MHQHRTAWAYGDQLHLEPQYFWRYVLGCTAIAVWLLFIAFTLTNPEYFEIPFTGRSVGPLLVYLASPLVLVGAGAYLRGQYLCLDRKAGQILMAKGFLGKVFDWQRMAAFDPTGTMHFQYCQAELQMLCILSYQAPESERWLMLHIYTQPAVARAVAEEMRQWESRLSVIEEEDQAALPDAQAEKPLVE